MFLDHKSSFGYSHLCISTLQEETLKSKTTYEKLAGTHGVKVKAYQVDNGRFDELGFREAIAEANQIITFCGVGSHHQNRIIERYIHDIPKSSRTLFLRVKRHWTKVIGTILWPFFLKAAENRRNHLKLDEYGLAPIHKFSKVFTNVEIKHWNTCGYTVFVLEAKA